MPIVESNGECGGFELVKGHMVKKKKKSWLVKGHHYNVLCFVGRVVDIYAKFDVIVSAC